MLKNIRHARQLVWVLVPIYPCINVCGMLFVALKSLTSCSKAVCFSSIDGLLQKAQNCMSFVVYCNKIRFCSEPVANSSLKYGAISELKGFHDRKKLRVR